MQRVGEFEKVSYEQFCKDMKAEFYNDGHDGDVEKQEEIIQQIYNNIQLPRRATKDSAGYDFKAPFEISLRPGESIKIPTGICARMEEGWWLGCLPRSGLGFKYRLQLNNTMGVIDGDYYHSSNGGHIFVKITNDSNEGRNVNVKTGNGFLQAIFLPYGITYSDEERGVRDGGMGSTDR